ncbi:MAG TPA: hypothetical protein DCM86_11635, partial [Verrucomicrobiales bacterium]|nr:hypothetical protein [Verrucomicrobiales bacterium]
MRRAAFTLLEVVLAIVIAIGILVVALYFYQQSTRLRGQLIEESDRLATVRLLIDRMTQDLRSAFPDTLLSFSGDASSMTFVHTGLPSTAALGLVGDPRQAPRQTDLWVVRYGVTLGRDGTNQVVSGLTRVEEPRLDAHPGLLTLTTPPAGQTSA